MVPVEVRTAIQELMILLGRGDYDAMLARCAATRLAALDVFNVIRNYGHEIVAPPAEAYERLDAIAIEDRTPPTWSVRMPVWTREEGQSDLTLAITISVGRERAEIELDDLLVL